MERVLKPGPGDSPRQINSIFLWKIINTGLKCDFTKYIHGSLVHDTRSQILAIYVVIKHMLMKIFLIKSLSRLIKAIFQVVEHKADVVRLQLMLEVGGMYMDTDSVVVKSLDEFRNKDLVLGQATSLSVGKTVA